MRVCMMDVYVYFEENILERNLQVETSITYCISLFPAGVRQREGGEGGLIRDGGGGRERERGIDDGWGRRETLIET